MISSAQQPSELFQHKLSLFLKKKLWFKRSFFRLEEKKEFKVIKENLLLNREDIQEIIDKCNNQEDIKFDQFKKNFVKMEMKVYNQKYKHARILEKRHKSVPRHLDAKPLKKMYEGVNDENNFARKGQSEIIINESFQKMVFGKIKFSQENLNSAIQSRQYYGRRKSCECIGCGSKLKLKKHLEDAPLILDEIVANLIYKTRDGLKESLKTSNVVILIENFRQVINPNETLESGGKKLLKKKVQEPFIKKVKMLKTTLKIFKPKFTKTEEETKFNPKTDGELKVLESSEITKQSQGKSSCGNSERFATFLERSKNMDATQKARRYKTYMMIFCNIMRLVKADKEAFGIWVEVLKSIQKNNIKNLSLDVPVKKPGDSHIISNRKINSSNRSLERKPDQPKSRNSTDSNESPQWTEENFYKKGSANFNKNSLTKKNNKIQTGNDDNYVPSPRRPPKKIEDFDYELQHNPMHNHNKSDISVIRKDEQSKPGTTMMFCHAHENKYNVCKNLNTKETISFQVKTSLSRPRKKKHSRENSTNLKQNNGQNEGYNIKTSNTNRRTLLKSRPCRDSNLASRSYDWYDFPGATKYNNLLQSEKKSDHPSAKEIGNKINQQINSASKINKTTNLNFEKLKDSFYNKKLPKVASKTKIDDPVNDTNKANKTNRDSTVKNKGFELFDIFYGKATEIIDKADEGQNKPNLQDEKSKTLEEITKKKFYYPRPFQNADFKNVLHAKSHMTKIRQVKKTSTKMLNFEKSKRQKHYVEQAYAPQSSLVDIKANFIVKMAEYDCMAKGITSARQMYNHNEDTLLERNRIFDIDKRFHTEREKFVPKTDQSMPNIKPAKQKEEKANLRNKTFEDIKNYAKRTESNDFVKESYDNKERLQFLRQNSAYFHQNKFNETK